MRIFSSVYIVSPARMEVCVEVGNKADLIWLRPPCYKKGKLLLCYKCSHSVEWNVMDDNLKIFKDRVREGMELDPGNLHMINELQLPYLSNSFLEVLQRVYKRCWYSNPKRDQESKRYGYYEFQPPSLLDLARWKIRSMRDSVPLSYDENIPNLITDLINFRDLN